MPSIESNWKPVVSYEDVYEVSDSGQVRRLCGDGCKKTRFVKGKLDKRGYRRIGLSKFGEPKHFFVHRLVVESHLKLIPAGMTVNHIDGDKTNNNIKNLELLSFSDNIKHAWATGLAGVHKMPLKLSIEEIREIRSNPEGHTKRTLARTYNISYSYTKAITSYRVRLDAL